MGNLGIPACVVASAMLLGCGKDGTTTPDGDDEPGFEIKVSPLRLDRVGEVQYGITVRRNGGEVVWSKDAILSSVYGDGKGAMAYIGPCDASAGSNPHAVELVIESVKDELGGDVPFINPTADGPLVILQDCLPNRDQQVFFDLTIMREATQGFFDVGVNFSDIYCSAKFDCVDEEGGPRDLLFNGMERDRSVVLGFACTTGAGSQTWLHISNVHVECYDPEGPLPQPVVREVAPLGEGNLGPVSPFFFETASYRGEESLVPYDKCYWNMAFGVNEGANTRNCRLKVTGTASDDSWDTRDGWSPPGSVYPYIEWDIPLTDEDGIVSCERDPLNGIGSNVTTEYTDFSGGKFTNEWKCGADVVTTEKVSCAANIQGVSTQASFTQTPQGVTVAFGAEPPTQQFLLPADYGAVDDCCFNPCCTDATPPASQE